ncbi:hypothetical protein HQ535_03420 [bacterium]|nr:hypothetical protein [bacterium]
MVRHRWFRLVAILLVALATTGCLDELTAIFEIIAFEESEDPQVRRTGKVLREIKDEREVENNLKLFRETGDRRYLANAKAIQPGNQSILAYEAVLATLRGDPADIEATQRAVALAESRRLQALNRPDDDPITAFRLRRNVLGEILVAQTEMLGGSLNRHWEPPGPDADAETLQLYQNYCATRLEIQSPPFNDSLEYIPLPPCPSA